MSEETPKPPRPIPNALGQVPVRRTPNEGPIAKKPPRAEFLKLRDELIAKHMKEGRK